VLETIFFSFTPCSHLQDSMLLLAKRNYVQELRTGSEKCLISRG